MLPPSAYLCPTLHFTITQQKEKQKYLHCTNSGFSEKKIKRRMKLVREEILGAAGLPSPWGKGNTDSSGGPRRRDPNAAQCFPCRCSGGSSFRKTDPERRPREQSMLEAPPQLGQLEMQAVAALASARPEGSQSPIHRQVLLMGVLVPLLWTRVWGGQGKGSQVCCHSGPPRTGSTTHCCSVEGSHCPPL